MKEQIIKAPPITVGPRKNSHKLRQSTIGTTKPSLTGISADKADDSITTRDRQAVHGDSINMNISRKELSLNSNKKLLIHSARPTQFSNENDHKRSDSFRSTMKTKPNPGDANDVNNHHSTVVDWFENENSNCQSCWFYRAQSIQYITLYVIMHEIASYLSYY